ncbi:MAG: endonuclease III domain-containing protein [Candidatus Omnitrophota bacterium]
MRKISSTYTLFDIYRLLHKRFGPQYWWPGDTRLEIILGAILTQNTNWTNVEKAIKNLKKEKLLSVKALNAVSEKKLAGLIRPAGYFNIKAKRIKNFLGFLYKNYNGSIKNMFSKSLEDLRIELLGVNGIGPETADSILLYAGRKKIFVVDSYTKRIFGRHGLLNNDPDYSKIQATFMKGLPNSLEVFNEYHALIVKLGKEHCRSKKPLCSDCPIGGKNG